MCVCVYMYVHTFILHICIYVCMYIFLPLPSQSRAVVCLRCQAAPTRYARCSMTNPQPALTRRLTSHVYVCIYMHTHIQINPGMYIYISLCLLQFLNFFSPVQAAWGHSRCACYCALSQRPALTQRLAR